MKRSTYTLTAQKRGSTAVGCGDSLAAVTVVAAVLITAAAPVVVVSAFAGAVFAVVGGRAGERVRARGRPERRGGGGRPCRGVDCP